MEPRKPAKNVLKCVKSICPSAEELGVITNNVKCDKCGLIFQNEPRYRLHDLKVHQRKNLDKAIKENVEFHCPVKSCIYAPKAERHFSSMKYLKQHYLKVHAKKTYACSRCEKSFSTEAAKEGHARVCGIEFTCSCLKIYSSYEALLTHAKRSLHTINDKYKSSLSRRTNSKALQLILPSSHAETNKLIAILPTNQSESKISNCSGSNEQKITSDIGVQTDENKRNKRISGQLKHINNGCYYNGKRGISKQTQTNIPQRIKQNVMSMETQTTDAFHAIKSSHKIRKPRKNCVSQNSDYTLLKEDLNLSNFTSSNLFPNSPLPLSHDVGLQDFWEEKSTSGTQTIPEKDMFEALNDNVTQTEFETFYDHSTNPLIQCVPKSTVALMTLPYVEETATTVGGYSFVPSNSISRSDPMLTDKTFDDKFSSIETQTEQAYSQSFFDSDTLTRSFALSSNIETQTTNNLDNMEQLLYSNTCTQTCNDIIPSDLGLSNIQTQTAWTELEDTTVSTETQTKSLICETGCNISIGVCRSWLSTQTSHTETQTDLLSIFEGLQ
ncbi:ASCIZ zinc finger protein isoform X1 [Colletes latitarsis]|uniref:ASCIZ zinc finger protein isoform X1 n=1 Tax=Colletes latitarsis TaxID=2605962 RepID=UPI004035360D